MFLPDQGSDLVVVDGGDGDDAVMKRRENGIVCG